MRKRRALNDCGSSIKKEETSLTLMWILSGGATKKLKEMTNWRAREPNPRDPVGGGGVT